MLEYYYKRLAYKVLSWFIPKRVWRIELGKKLGFGERIITLQEVDKSVPKCVLDSINALLGRHLAWNDKALLDSKNECTNTAHMDCVHHRIYAPNPFLQTYKTHLNPTPLATIVANHSLFAPPPNL